MEKLPEGHLEHGSAFDALFEPEQAANLKVRAALMRRLERFIEDHGLTQEEAAERFGTSQPRVSDLLNGNISKFTIDALLNMCTQAGIEVEVRFSGTRTAA